MSEADNEVSSVSKDIDNYLKKLAETKVPVPDIDFTIHEMDDGSKVSTLDRYCKGSCSFFDSYINLIRGLRVQQTTRIVETIT